MPSITRRRTGELLRRLFEILMDSADEVPAREALERLSNSVALTEYEKGTYTAGARRFEKIVRFATIDCVKAGWLEKNKGRWSVTDAGQVAYKTYPDPEEFYRQAVKLFNQWKASQPQAEAPADEVTPEQVSEKEASITFEEAEEQAWGEIELYIGNMPPYEFQKLVGTLLDVMGYHVSWIAPPGKDGGVDILAWTDPLGTRPPRIKVQVKRQVERVRVEGLRAFMSVLGDDDVGLFVCTAGFTKDAEDLARSQETRKITLIDLERLFDLWVEHYDKLKDEARRRLPLKKIFFLSPEP